MSATETTDAPPVEQTASGGLPYARLAERLYDRIDGAEWDRFSVELTMPCPLDSATVTLTATASPLGDPVRCSGGCDEGDLLDALQFLAVRLPMRCQDVEKRFHNPRTCLRCRRYDGALYEASKELDQRYGTVREASAEDDLLVSGDFVLDVPAVAPIWGTAPRVLAAQGQAMTWAGPNGSSKTTIGCEYAKKRIRLPGWGDTLWGEYVEPLRDDLRVWHLAADRPAQALESWARGLTEGHREILRDRVRIWRGPVPMSLATPAGQKWLIERVIKHSIGSILFDSRKDFGSVLDLDSVISINNLMQRLCAMDVEVVVMAHINKGSRGYAGGLESISGMGDVVNGMGSVFGFDADPGGTRVKIHHLKPVRELLSPFEVEIDQAAGTSQLVASSGGMVLDKDGNLVSGAMPVNAIQNLTLLFFDAQPDGKARGPELEKFLTDRGLGTKNVSRDMAALVDAGIVKNEGRGANSRWMRGDNAPA